MTRSNDVEIARDTKFIATPEKGEVSALLIRPASATHLLVLGHGASSNMRVPMMTSIAEALAAQNFATFRYNFPYSENGRGRDGKDVCIETVRSAIAAARRIVPDLPVIAGGHSFGGRMTSTAAAKAPLEGVVGLVFYSFPLHPAGQPATTRAEHLADVDVPMLFLSGTRDSLAVPELLGSTIKKLGKLATLRPIDTADHSFKILRKTRASGEDVFAEMARLVREWCSEHKL
jgi:predicted alpha/beta-hydrolase family hydrolase